MDWENLYSHLKILNLIVLLVLASASLFLMSPAFTTGIIIGGLMIIANFHMFQKTIRQGFFLKNTKMVRKASVIAKFYFRLALMGILIYFFISQRWVHPVGFAIGLSIVVISILSLAIILVRKTFSEETL